MNQRVLILGIDGYIGWALANHILTHTDYELCGLDNLSRRKYVEQAGSDSLTPISTFSQRERFLRTHSKFLDMVCCVDLESYYHIDKILAEFKPTTIIHLAEQPSAPWSMINPLRAIETQVSNTAGTLALLWAMKKHCPDAHLIKLGSMGEYGTPNCDIPEGVIPETCIEDIKDLTYGYCPMSGLLFPRQPGSFYHLSKVFDTYNVKFTCDIWGLRSTDIMQGVVFGLYPDDAEDIQLTRFDYDQYFGTVINRFCAQVLAGIPMTVYGEGNHIRSFLPLRESIECLMLTLENPPGKGEYRTFNQFGTVHSIKDLANKVATMADAMDEVAEIEYLPNPRTEVPNHIYNVDNANLRNLGYNPILLIDTEIALTLATLRPYRRRIKTSVIQPTTTWK